MDNKNEEFESFLYDSNAHDLDAYNELEKRMAEPLLKHSGQFDILSWWKGKIKEYPILTRIARDVLAVQVSTVASESAFSAGGRVVDPYRSSLNPDMVEALICTKDWIAAARKVNIHNRLLFDVLFVFDFQDTKKLATLMTDLEVMEAIAALQKLEIMVDEDEPWATPLDEYGIESDPDEMRDHGEL